MRRDLDRRYRGRLLDGRHGHARRQEHVGRDTVSIKRGCKLLQVPGWATTGAKRRADMRDNTHRRYRMKELQKVEYAWDCAAPQCECADRNSAKARASPLPGCPR